MIMATAVATCSPTMYARYGDSGLETSRSWAHCPPISAGISTAWPRLDIGKSSVILCKRLTTPASAYVRCDMPALRSHGSTESHFYRTSSGAGATNTFFPQPGQRQRDDLWPGHQ